MEQNITLELVYQRQVSLEQTLNLILELLKTEEKKKKEMQEAAEDISAIPPIPNSLAAKLLKITTRQLQRKRREYKLTWIERGREVFYHIVPIIKAIHRLQLKWNESVLEDIKKSNHRIPKVK